MRFRMLRRPLSPFTLQPFGQRGGGVAFHLHLPLTGACLGTPAQRRRDTATGTIENDTGGLAARPEQTQSRLRRTGPPRPEKINDTTRN